MWHALHYQLPGVWSVAQTAEPAPEIGSPASGGVRDAQAGAETAEVAVTAQGVRGAVEVPLPELPYTKVAVALSGTVGVLDPSATAREGDSGATESAIGDGQTRADIAPSDTETEDG